jgi:type VI protein secretion system component Hcp
MIHLSTRIRTACAAGALATASLFTQPAGAAGYQMVIHIPGAGASDYALRGFSWGEEGTGFSKGAPGELTFTRVVDRYSPTLAQIAQRHGTVPSAELDVTVAYGGRTTTVMKLVMTNVTLWGLRQSGSMLSSDLLPDESVTLRFSTLAYTFQPTTADGSLSGPPSTVIFDFREP